MSLALRAEGSSLLVSKGNGWGIPDCEVFALRTDMERKTDVCVIRTMGNNGDGVKVGVPRR